MGEREGEIERANDRQGGGGYTKLFSTAHLIYLTYMYMYVSAC